MTETKPETGEFPPTHIDAEFAEVIGHVAAAWASIELNINIGIWVVAGLSPSLGACLTSQQHP